MKRKVTALLTALLLTLTLCVPTLAWTEYGAIYDETDALGSDELSDLGQYTLPQLEACLQVLLELDQSLKSQPVAAQTLLETALCRLALAGSGR